MESLKLVAPDIKYQKEYLDFIKASAEDIQKCGMGYYMPFSDDESFSMDIQRLLNNSKGIELPAGWVPASTYWLISEDSGRILGTTTLRHKLTEYLTFRGGHISYYIHPMERQKGYSTKMLSLCLDKCRAHGFEKVLITCAKHNTGSAKTIQNNGGVLHSEDVENGEVFQRYWVEVRQYE